MTDRAIVVGINNYPAFSPQLEGPEKDALAFKQWLINDAKVPAENIATILSSDYPQIPGQPTATIQPALDDVIAKFTELVQLATKNFQRLPRIGRRLYIYLSGHGITPRSTGQLDSAALLMANAEPESAGLHLPGPAYADWFRRSHAFSEIVLIMDCCRNAYDDIDQMPVPFPPLKGGDPKQVRTFYALATQWDAVAFEQPIGTPPQKRGVFTYALLEALRSGGTDPSGRLTAIGLAKLLETTLPKLRQGDMPQFPKFSLADLTKDIVLVESRPVPRTIIEWKPPLHGRSVEIRDGSFQPLVPPLTAQAGPANSQLSLKPGLYGVFLNDTEFHILKIQPGLSEDAQDVGLVSVE
jgi:hypothetical protein